jgi:transposase
LHSDLPEAAALALSQKSMPKPYSYDLRQKVIQAIEFDGLNKSEASLLFNISRNTIDLWSRATSRNRGLSSLAQSSSW